MPNQAIAILPDGSEIVLAEFETHKQAHDYINKVVLASK